MAPIPSSRATNAATTDESCAPTGLLVLWLGRALATLRWLRDKAWRRLRQLRSRSVQKTDTWTAWYNDLYRRLGERAMQTARPAPCDGCRGALNKTSIPSLSTLPKRTQLMRLHLMQTEYG